MPDPSVRLSGSVRGVDSSAIRDLLTLTARPEVISLAGGLPAAEMLPTARMADAAWRVLRSPEAAQYTETTGIGALRELLARRQSAELGREVDARDVVVTSGSQQALDLIARALVDPGDAVVLEEPAYPGARQVFQSVGARIESVPLDADGMCTGRLGEMLAAGLRPVLVHTVATFHNPRGVTLAAARRVRLAALADRYGFLVVEDDPYGQLYFHTPPPAPVAAASDLVVRLGSASKTLAPALRTGWLTGPRELCRAVERLKQAADLCGSALSQSIAVELLSDEEWLAAHLASLRAVYGERATALAAAMRTVFGERITCTDPDGGMFCWVQFRDGTDTDRLLAAAVTRGVAFVPGGAFSPWLTTALRLSYATAAPEVLRDGVARLASAHASI
ncbi:PLP-dependent aminotransferase family protein [Speluncibacter jeojiensis]|uniref:PLP-dependent aminotransferase family protein n=1 Tax=Speluncibacter jeojiensis TaxID=2710754 RepID=A0A9X4M200_9ACTN|nr:PLP-dependent aminotransferase family protein [Corynebacteriales bacterium D3-21]